MADYSLINYDLITKTKKLKIKELEKYNPFEITILYYQIPLFEKDYLLVLCENNLILINITTFIIEYNLSLKDKPISMEIFALNNVYSCSIMFKYKISFYIIEKNNNKNSKNPLNFSLAQEIQSPNDEKIISERLFIYRNLFGFQIETKIIVNTFKNQK
jgi:hypothetical protein